MNTTANDMDKEVFSGFIEESMEGLDAAESAIIALEADPQDTDLMAAIFRAAHSLKGNSAFFGLMHVKTLAHRMEDLLDAVRQKRVSDSRQVIDALLPGLDLLRQMLESVRDNGPELIDPAVFEETLKGLDQALQGKKAADPSLVSVRRSIQNAREHLPDDLKSLLDEALRLTKAEKEENQSKASRTRSATPGNSRQASVETPSEGAAVKKKSRSEKTLRIAENSLDAFLDHVGELIGIEEMLRYCLRQAGKTDGTGTYRELKQVVEQFSKISADLRCGIMETRKVQAKALLDKAPRLVRDIGANAGKQIRLQISGGDMRIDKNYAELLDAPLVHMVRNAADHGIETSKEREQAGKSVEGTIQIELAEQENDIRLTISDDGRGLNRDALTRKAVNMGLVEPGRPLSENDIVSLLFQSGVSTAAEITDISGRGVGMDVVKQAIDAAGGRIKVNSNKGLGSTFTILLPKNVSTKITDGYLVRARDHSTYVLPLKFVLEAFVTGRNEITTVKGQGRVVKRRESLHPVVDLGTAVQGDDHANAGAAHGPSAEKATLVLLDIGGKTIAFAVSEIIGVQKVVVKPIVGLGHQDNMIEGAAMMGDGAVALILGEHGLAALLEKSGPEPPSSAQNPNKETM
jgi:two-component system, chemotaxis family, sensor kinase CheA